MFNQKFSRILNIIATAKWMDFIGVLIVVISCIISGYLTETLKTVQPTWGTWTAFVPFGIISIFNTILSIMSTRLTSRMDNWGNIVGVVNAFLSGLIDWILGNSAAPITYPVTLIIYLFAIRKWKNSEKYKASKPLTGTKGKLVMILITLASLIFSALTNYIGFKSLTPLYWLSTLVFGLSMSANILNAMKLSVQWSYWVVYDLVQLIKALVQQNFANVGKYIYYIITGVAGLDFWYKRTPKENKLITNN